MNTMNGQVSNSNSHFSSLLQEVAAKHLYVKIHYYSDLHELLKVTSVVKGLENKEGIEHLLLANGDSISVNRLVKIGDTPAPGHDADDFYNCACS
jgi:hypothetical protein